MIYLKLVKKEDRRIYQFRAEAVGSKKMRIREFREISVGSGNMRIWN